MIAQTANLRNSEKTVEVNFKSDITGNRKPGIKLDNTKLKDLGWTLTVSLQEGIENTMNEFSR